MGCISCGLAIDGQVIILEQENGSSKVYCSPCVEVELFGVSRSI